MTDKRKEKKPADDKPKMEVREPPAPAYKSLPESLDRDTPVTQGEFREAMFEINARMDTRFAEVETEFVRLRGDMNTGFSELRAELKGDIADLRAELKGDIADLRADIVTKIEESHRKTIQYFVGVLFGFSGLMSAVVFGILHYMK